MEEQKRERKETYFEAKIRPILKYVGTIGAVLMCIAYIAIVLIMVFGFQASVALAQQITFAVVNAVIGLIIMQLLKVQGIDFAKELPENQEILTKYYKNKAKIKKPRSMNYFWISSFIKDFLLKGSGLVITTIGIIYIVIVGTNNYSLLLLAVVNILMFICFGLLSLVSAYDFFNNENIPYLQEVIENEEQKALEAKIQRDMEMAKAKLIEQRNANLHVDRGGDILDSSVDTDAISDNDKSVVVDCSECSDNVLGGAANSSDSASDRTDICTQENTPKN